ncbi:MAG: DNA-binding NtrC family response regulator [Alteromonadaceae bacterium]|jgi:DNA-binding NtrC family response regulator
MTCILVVEDRPDIRLSLAILLEDHGYKVLEADNPQMAQVLLKTNDVALILLDMNYSLDTSSGEEGLAFLKWLQSMLVLIPRIAMTAWSNTDLVVKAMKLGATDFIEKPWRNKQLLHVIEQQLNYNTLQEQNTQLKAQLSDHTYEEYQWRSPCMLTFLKKMSAVADTDVSILLTGDNGTGKSDLARNIHQQSLRKNEALISVNMGAISESLFESEMFGHKKGAFTDAKTARVGRFELAEKGTLFLDEIANIPLSQQAKLLRVLESGEYEVLGSSQTKKSDIRIISATNGNFIDLFDKALFREDLYYRLNTIEFRVPSLKERSDDIIPLTEFFITKFCVKYKRELKMISAEAKQALLDYHWPGNIRELSHLVERALLLAEDNEIALDDLHLSNKPNQDALPLMTLAAAEIKLIKQALSATQDNVPKAAILLGLTKSSMYRRIEKYNLAQN